MWKCNGWSHYMHSNLIFADGLAVTIWYHLHLMVSASCTTTQTKSTFLASASLESIQALQLREAPWNDKCCSNGFCPNIFSTPPPSSNRTLWGYFFRRKLVNFLKQRFWINMPTWAYGHMRKKDKWGIPEKSIKKQLRDVDVRSLGHSNKKLWPKIEFWIFWIKVFQWHGCVHHRFDCSLDLLGNL